MPDYCHSKAYSVLPNQNGFTNKVDFTLRNREDRKDPVTEALGAAQKPSSKT